MDDIKPTSAAAIWWKRLSPLKRELFESKYGNINDEKINDIYKKHTDVLYQAFNQKLET